jgi:hypothetical protein
MSTAEEHIEMATKVRERRPLTRSEAQRLGAKELVHAARESGRIYRGRVVAMAEDGAGPRYVVLDTGRYVTALPATGQTFERGRELRARSRMEESPAERRRVLAWQIDDLEHERRRGRERER